jgi:hypothetical protein
MVGGYQGPNTVFAQRHSVEIQKLGPDGTLVKNWGELFGDGPGQFAQAAYPIAADAAGNVYAFDQGPVGHSRMQKFDGNGTFLLAWGTTGDGPGQFRRPGGIAVDGRGDVYVTDSHVDYYLTSPGPLLTLGQDRVQRFSSDGTFIATWGSTGDGPGQFFLPQAIAVDPAGSIYVMDPPRHSSAEPNWLGRLQKFVH